MQGYLVCQVAHFSPLALLCSGIYITVAVNTCCSGTAPFWELIGARALTASEVG